MKKKADLLLLNFRVYTQDKNRTVLKNADIAVLNGRFAEIGKNLSEKWEAPDVTDGTGKAVFPGMHNMHVHIFQSVMKGLGADRKLIDWLQDGPMKYGPSLTPEVYAMAAELACMESLKCGVTTIGDFNYLQQNDIFPHVSIETAERFGIREIYMDVYHDTGEEMGIVPSFIHPAAECIRRTEKLVRQYNTDGHPLIRIWAGASVPWGTTENLYREMTDFSESTGIPYTMHILETPEDNAYTEKHYGKPVVEALESMHVLTERFLAVHCVNLKEDEMDVLARHDVNAVYCPAANCYLGSGIAPAAAMLRHGVNITMGTDGAASNNSSDMIESMKLGLFLQKAEMKDPTALSAQDMLDFVTVNAAKAEHDRESGSVEEGKKADFFIMNTGYARSCPDYDTLAALMYNASQENIEATAVNGHIVYRDGNFACGLEEKSSVRRIQEAMEKIVM